MSENQHTIVAIFAQRAQAEGAVDELWHAGYTKEQIGMAAPGEELREATTPTENLEETAANGAVAGAVTGGALGVMTGAAVVATVPGVGPVLAMGLLLGLTTGAALGTFAGPFIALGLSREAAEHYESEFKAGRCMVVVRSPKPEPAMLILQEHHPDYVEVDGRRVQVQSA